MSETVNEKLASIFKDAIDGSSYSDYHTATYSSPPAIKTDRNHAASRCAEICREEMKQLAKFQSKHNFHLKAEGWVSFAQLRKYDSVYTPDEFIDLYLNEKP